MTGSNRVAWREGQFLRPQHFQQADRSVDRRIAARANDLRPYAWGLSEIQIDEDVALLGKFVIVKARGVLPDGTPFSIPEDLPPPPPLDIPGDTRDATVYLTLPVAQAGAQEFAEAESAGPDVRFLVEEVEVVDCFSPERARESVELGRPNLSFGVTRDQTYGRVLCGLAHVREVQGSRVIFDDRYIPPVQDIAASYPLRHGLEDILNRCEQRGNEFALRAVEATDGGTATFVSFLLLQALNRWMPVLRHLHSLPLVHPERLYEQLASLAGEISTMIRPDRKVPIFPAYDHEDLRGTFAPLFDLLQTMLGQPIGASAVQLPLDQAGPGAWFSPIVDRNLYQHGFFFLAVRAAASAEEVRARFPSVSKVGPVERMQEIVDAATATYGIPLRHTPTPPPQIRALPGFVYFELDRGVPNWAEFATSTALGLHVAGDWPQLRLELWCVKGDAR